MWCSIVLEVPNLALGPKRVGLWARILANADGNWVQAERCARPYKLHFCLAVKESPTGLGNR